MWQRALLQGPWRSGVCHCPSPHRRGCSVRWLTLSSPTVVVRWSLAWVPCISYSTLHYETIGVPCDWSRTRSLFRSYSPSKLSMGAILSDSSSICNGQLLACVIARGVHRHFVRWLCQALVHQLLLSSWFAFVCSSMYLASSAGAGNSAGTNRFDPYRVVGVCIFNTFPAQTVIHGRNHPCWDKNGDELDVPCYLQILGLEIRCDASDLAIYNSGVWLGSFKRCRNFKAQIQFFKPVFFEEHEAEVGALVSNKCFAGMRKVTSHSERNSIILASSLGRMFWVALNAGSRSGTCAVVALQPSLWRIRLQKEPAHFGVPLARLFHIDSDLGQAPWIRQCG